MGAKAAEIIAALADLIVVVRVSVHIVLLGCSGRNRPVSFHLGLDTQGADVSDGNFLLPVIMVILALEVAFPNHRYAS